MSGRVVELGLRLTHSPLGPAAAWLFPGDDPRGWLRELAGWGGSLLGLRCYVVPRQPGDPTPLGLFVLAPPQAGAPSPRALPDRRVGPRLYVPVDASLDPLPTPRELHEWAGDPLVFHPGVGLIGLEPSDALGPAELLAPPERRDSAWDVARSGPERLPTLASVTPAQPPSLKRIFAAVQEGIGDKAGAKPPERAPAPKQPAPRETGPESAPEPGADRGVGGWLRRQAGLVGDWLSGKGEPPQQPPKDGPPSPEDIQRDRQEELRRLADLLEQDPDEGLRYALPLAGSGGRKGPQAPPGRQLPPRKLDLNLRGRSGTAGRDPWEITPDMHLLLRRRYREAANRELALGRYERAAYVFLELLGDTRAAAQALEQGKRYREAALLYRERLHQPLEAARCLERGGLLDEAAQLFADCGEDERAARLYRTLGKADQAERHFRRAAASLQRGGDLRRAARLIDRDVGAPEEALDMLAEAWPLHRQAAPCLQDRFGLLARLGRHEEADRLVGELIEVPTPSRRHVGLVESLERVAGNYPVASVAERARDGVRVVAGLRLGQANRIEAEQLLRAVGRLRPQDKLLARDVGRYVARVRGGRKRKPKSKGGVLEVVGELQLPRDTTWRVVVPAGRGFYAAGESGDGLVAARGRWDGSVQVVRWEGGVLSGPLLLAPAASPNCPSVLVPTGQEPLPMRYFPADESFVERGRIGTPGWIPSSCRAIATSPVGVVMAVHGNHNALVLSTLDAMEGGGVLSTRLLASKRGAQEEPQVRLLALRDRFFLALGHRLEWRERETVLHTVELDHPATGLVASPRDSCLVVTHAAGATALFSRGRRVEQLPVARDLEAPMAAFTREGLLAVFGRTEVRCYEVRGELLVHRDTFQFRGDPLALAPTWSYRRLAVFDRLGSVRILELPSL